MGKHTTHGHTPFCDSQAIYFHTTCDPRWKWQKPEARTRFENWLSQKVDAVPTYPLTLLSAERHELEQEARVRHSVQRTQQEYPAPVSSGLHALQRIQYEPLSIWTSLQTSIHSFNNHLLSPSLWQAPGYPIGTWWCTRQDPWSREAHYWKTGQSCKQFLTVLWGLFCDSKSNKLLWT